MRVTPRDVYEGLAAAAAALLAMAGIAAAGLSLLDADRIGGLGALTAAVVALAVGGSAKFGAVPAGGLPVTVQGGVHVMPLGVSLVGAVVLGALLLRRGRDGLLVRGAAAAATFPAGLAMVAWAARGTVTFRLPDGTSAAGGGLGVPGCSKGGVPAAGGLPFGGGGPLGALDAGFSVAVGPASAAAVGWALAVVGVCWLAVRFRVAAAGLRAVLWLMGGITVVGLLVAWASGGAAAAGGVLLVLPLAVFGALLLGLGVPWTVSSEGMLSCVLDGAGPLSPGGPLIWVSGAALLGCAIVAASAAASAGGRPGGPLRRAADLAVRLAPVVGAVLAAMALLSRVSAGLGINAFGFSLPVLDAQVAANPLLALGAGLAGGAVAGLAGSLLVDGFRSRASVAWPTWNDQDRR
ncbi:streptophobe family protein [Qaidamihabitans albus]|uniref:streptophobe family protein n=1 Tax=Qaidamihabitans albus TaxID=2795733 RepID=UPI0027DCE678|nr:streptophobe family protein [Qaidamihabitans albus]